MNLIPVIREALGLQENEEFKIKDRKGLTVYNKCRFTHKGMQVNITGFWENSKNEIVGMLVKGQCEVVKLPFKPKEGELYHFVSLDNGDAIGTSYYSIIPHHKLRVESGNCYRTQEEAEKHSDEWMSKVYGENWEELLK